MHVVKIVTTNLKTFGWMGNYQQKHKKMLRKEEQEEQVQETCHCCPSLDNCSTTFSPVPSTSTSTLRRWHHWWQDGWSHVSVRYIPGCC